MFDADSLPYYDPAKERKVAVITGGSSGIGWYTVLHLYMHGYVVYICGRNSNRVNEAIKDVQREAQVRVDQRKPGPERPAAHFGSLHYLHSDLSDLKCVERAAAKLRKREEKLDVLINNAAAVGLPYKLTKDNFELQLQTNYIAHFLLSMRLLPLLQKARGRLITNTSVCHQLEFRYWPLSQGWNYRPNMVFTWLRYATSTTASIQFTKMMAIKYPEVLCLSIRPGMVMNTHLFSYWTRLPIVGIFFWMLFQIVALLFGVSYEQGSLATLKCILSPHLTTDKDNGKYFITGAVESKPSYVANNLDDAASTWIWTVHALRDRGFEV